MRRLARWTLNALTALSLLLCVASATMWVRSWFVVDNVRFAAGNHSALLATGYRALLVRWTTPRFFKPAWETRRPSGSDPFAYSRTPTHRVLLGISGRPHEYAWLGCSFWPTYYQPPSRDVRDPGCWFTTVRVPLRSLVVATALWPLLRGVRWVKRRRRSVDGRCLVCAYDLTGNVSGVCPECGARVTMPVTGEP